MRAADIPSALILSRQAHWNQVIRDWELFLQLSPEGCKVAELENIVGTAATISYEHYFSWIGMILVDEAHQNQGIGRRLLQEALDYLKEKETIKLDATPKGRSLYSKLDFIDEYMLHRMHQNSVVPTQSSTLSRPIQQNEIPKLLTLDQNIFGATRQELLQWLYEGAPQYAFLAEDNLGVTGFCFGRQGENYIHIGPIVANDYKIAKDLLLAALNNCVGKEVILDVPVLDKEWMACIIDLGFKIQRPFYRMYLGGNRYPGIPENQFAITGPEFG